MYWCSKKKITPLQFGWFSFEEAKTGLQVIKCINEKEETIYCTTLTNINSPPNNLKRKINDYEYKGVIKKIIETKRAPFSIKKTKIVPIFELKKTESNLSARVNNKLRINTNMQ
jgi:hypothetical protein